MRPSTVHVAGASHGIEMVSMRQSDYAPLLRFLMLVIAGVAEWWCPNFARSAQCEQRHPGTPRLYHDDPLAAAEGKPPEPDDTSLSHRRAYHPEGLDRNRTIGIDVVGAVEIDRIDVAAPN